LLSSDFLHRKIDGKLKSEIEKRLEPAADCKPAPELLGARIAGCANCWTRERWMRELLQREHHSPIAFARN